MSFYVSRFPYRSYLNEIGFQGVSRSPYINLQHMICLAPLTYYPSVIAIACSAGEQVRNEDEDR